MTFSLNTLRRRFWDTAVRLHVTLAIITIWACCCLLGNETRPVVISPITPITCHVFFGETFHHTAVEGCKCRIQRKIEIPCIKWNLHVQTELLQLQRNRKSPTFNVLGSFAPHTDLEVKLQSENPEQQNTLRRILAYQKTNFSHITFESRNDKFPKTSSADIRRTLNKLNSKYRPLSLRPSGRTLPTNPRENSTFSPSAGIILYDVMNDSLANRAYLSQFTWECSIQLFYEDVYPGQLLGTTNQLVRDGSNEILFNDIVVSNWGYAYILQIQIRAKETSFWNLTCILGPFDVEVLDTLEQPLVLSDEFRKVEVVYDGDYKAIERDPQKFKIFLLNYFGRKYSNVRWKNVTVLEGSIIVSATITGLIEYLDMTSKHLTEAIRSGNADITYEKQLLRANQIFLPHSRKLLEEKSDDASGESGGLSVAWIVAIVINVVLILVFIVTIIYCYCRRKKQRAMSRHSHLQSFNGGTDPLIFNNKVENQNALREKAAIFTVEDQHTKLGNHRSFSGKIHDDDRSCSCASRGCYCSIGEGPQSEMTLHHREEENENDPQGYPTPSPEPRFPTPEPSPESEEFWRPDSYTQQEEEQEMDLPGAVTGSSPEEERFYVYLMTAIDGSRELIGQIYLKVESLLSETRRAIDQDSNLSDAIRGQKYRFLDENLDAISGYQESSLDLEKSFPSQGINIQYIPLKPPSPKPQVQKKPKVPAYVGPLGICNAPDCTRAAKIKCLDCRNVAYCTKRCMREDAKDHRMSCYKPAWRL